MTISRSNLSKCPKCNRQSYGVEYPDDCLYCDQDIIQRKEEERKKKIIASRKNKKDVSPVKSKKKNKYIAGDSLF